MADLTPYHAGDSQPAVVVHACPNTNATATVAAQYHLAMVSRTAAGAAWGSGKLATLAFPNTTGTAILKSDCTIDGNRYIFPYVYVDDVEGIRGRLSNIYHAGFTAPDAPREVPSPVGEVFSYGGSTYELVAANAGDGSGNIVFGPLGGVNNASGNASRSVVIALPVS
jgi:hypothetical protein